MSQRFIRKDVLEKVRTLSAFDYLRNAIGNEVITLTSNDKFNPSAFAHPLDFVLCQGRGDLERKVSIVDVRPFTKSNPIHGSQITKTIDYMIITKIQCLNFSQYKILRMK